MNNKISVDELKNVSGSLKYQESTEGNCPHCQKSFTIDQNKIKKVTEGCTDYYYYTCPYCGKDFQIESDK